MIRVVLAVLCICIARPAAAQDGTYLTDQATFSAAWSALEARIGPDPDIASLRVTPDLVEVVARAAAGGARLDHWQVERDPGLFRGDHAVSGPTPVRPSGPVGDVETGFFAARELPLDRFVAILADAASRAPLLDPGGVTDVTIARRVALIPRPSHADVRWTISIGNAREQAVAEAAIDGTILGLDISGTARGRARNFLTQDDWPFAEVQAGFRAVIGDAPVYEIEVRESYISLDAVSAEDPDQLTTISWDGGRFTRGLVDLPNVALLVPGGNLPFALSEVDLSMLPRIIAAARAEAADGARIASVHALREPRVDAAPTVRWVVTFPGGSGRSTSSDEDTVVRVSTDGRVVDVTLPVSERAPVSYLDPASTLAAIGQFQQAFGGSVKVFEFTVREDRAEIRAPSGRAQGMIATILLTDTGLSDGGDFPVMMETNADLFGLDVLARLQPGTLAAIAADAVERIGFADGEVFRMKIWSGAPFWRSPDGLPLIDVRVGVPPDHRTSGYAVFQLDGSLVEVVK